MIGSSMRSSPVGPMPGRTPTIVPSSTPTKRRRGSRGEAVARPSARLSRRSIGAYTGSQGPRSGSRSWRRHDEDEDAEDGQADGDRRALTRRVRGLASPARSAATKSDGTRPSPRTVSPKKMIAADDQDRRRATGRADGVALAGDEPLTMIEDAEAGEQDAQDEREEARTHPHGRPDLVRRRPDGEGKAEGDEYRARRGRPSAPSGDSTWARRVARGADGPDRPAPSLTLG